MFVVNARPPLSCATFSCQFRGVRYAVLFVGFDYFVFCLGRFCARFRPLDLHLEPLVRRSRVLDVHLSGGRRLGGLRAGARVRRHIAHAAARRSAAEGLLLLVRFLYVRVQIDYKVADTYIPLVVIVFEIGCCGWCRLTTVGLLVVVVMMVMVVVVVAGRRLCDGPFGGRSRRCRRGRHAPLAGVRHPRSVALAVLLMARPHWGRHAAGRAARLPAPPPSRCPAAHPATQHCILFNSHSPLSPIA